MCNAMYIYSTGISIMLVRKHEFNTTKYESVEVNIDFKYLLIYLRLITVWERKRIVPL